MPALDGLRACAVLAVMLFNFKVGWAHGGYFGVDAFFVLSGFLITSLLLDEHRRSQRLDLKAFWARRARRLLPALALVLVAVGAYASRAATPVELHQLRADGLSTIFYVANWNQIVSHVSYFQQFAAPSMLHHTWSLAIEEQFYVLWPLLVALLLRRGARRRGVLMGTTIALIAGSAALMALLYRPGHDPSRVYYGTDTRAQSLLMGALLAMVLLDRSATPRRSRARLLDVGGCVAALALAAIWLRTSYTDAWQYRGGFLISAVLVCVIIASVTRADARGPLAWCLSRAPLRAIGMISYGLYLWHYPVYVYVNADRTGLRGSDLVIVRILCTFAIATVSFFVIERPVRRGALRGWPIRVLGPVAATLLAGTLIASTAGAVPAALQSISPSQIEPPPVAATPSLGSARPLRIMLVGDSVAASVAPGVAAQAQARGELFWNVAVPGCGLATDVGERWWGEWVGVDRHCTPGWRERWPEQTARFHPDVVVVLLGTQDTVDRRINNTLVNFDTAAGKALAEEELTDAVTIFTEQHARVVFLLTPYYVQGWPMKVDPPRSIFNSKWIDEWNAIERDVARRSRGRVSWLDLNHYIDPGGTWTDTVNGVKVRGFDRMHLSRDGADYVGKWIVPALSRDATDAVSAPAPGVATR
jgi:peptidoglycan/LPS O-acetylase OafA/YrhL